MSSVSISSSGRAITIVPQPPRPVTIQRAGVQGRKGDQGNSGWSPVLAGVAHGQRRVLQIIGWTGGQGAEPSVGGFIGASGIVSDLASALDVRGAPGLGVDAPALAALLALTPAADRFAYYTGASAASLAPLTAFARTLLDDANAAAALSTLGAQPLDATLTAMSGVATAADRLLYFTGTDVAAATPLTAAARSLLDDTSAGAMLNTLGAAPLASPAFTGAPTGPTAGVAADSLQLCNVTMARAAAANAAAAVVGAAPAALNTLAELAAALGNDADFAETMTGALAGKQPLNAALTALAAAASGTSKADFRSAVGAVWGGDAPVPSAAGVGLTDGDLNKITVPGLYTIGNTWSNGPFGSETAERILEVRRRSSGNRYWQTLFYASGVRYDRYSVDGTTWGSWSRIAGPLLGAVAQSGGLPTGAEIERGSNGNGEYLRLADGTQICWSQSFTVDATTAAGALYVSGTQAWAYPVSFISVPVVLSVSQSGGAIGWGANSTPLISACSLLYVGTQSQTGRTVRGVAIGRWF